MKNSRKSKAAKLSRAAKDRIEHLELLVRMAHGVDPVVESSALMELAAWRGSEAGEKISHKI